MRKTILCVDDDESGLAIRKMLLETEGYDVITALSGTEALALLQERSIHAVILDFQMPYMDGAEVAARIREQRLHLPIILLSGYPESVPGDALALVDAFIKKGEGPERFLSVVSALVRYDQPATILNVDDHAGHRYAISRVLMEAGFDVVEATTGRDALAIAASRPNLILLDVNLPDLLGFEVCKQLRAQRGTRNIPVVHISATFDTDAAQQKSIASGANIFVEYPSDPKQIVPVVRLELQKRNAKLHPGYAS